MKDFKTFEQAEKYYRKYGSIGDYVRIGGKVYTQDNYDFSGREISYGNKEEKTAFVILTNNRYLSKRDALIQQIDFCERVGFYYLK